VREVEHGEIAGIQFVDHVDKEVNVRGAPTR
jgi:hypothetical protein